MPEEKVSALREVLTDRDPFCSGVCPVPEHLLWLYYTQGTQLGRLNFAHATTSDLEALAEACQPASFAFNNKDVLDGSYRKAGKMDLDHFSTPLDPRNLGIHNVIEEELLSAGQAVEFELYKLNVYGKDGFFKAHQDTPRGDGMFGTLVVILPAPYEGGQLSLRVDDRHWIVDFTEQVSAATVPSIYFVAFFGDVGHQVLPVTSGHRVTLTYNLHFRAKNAIPRAISSPFHQRLKEKLAALVNDPETLPDGGYLGIGLCHQYSYDETKPIDSLLDKLKGADAALAIACKELGLPYSLKLFYEGFGDVTPDFPVLSRVKVDVPGLYCDSTHYKRTRGYEADDPLCFLEDVVEPSDPADMEAVRISGKQTDVDSDFFEGNYECLRKFYKEPVPQVLEVKEMTSVCCETVYGAYGNEVSTEKFYGTACMTISVKPKGLRERLGA